MRGADTRTTDRARALRRAENDAEDVLWAELRNRRLNGYKFVRQLPIGPYFADFACRSELLVIEVDGSQHASSENDRHRDNYMARQGWSVLRFWNIDVLIDCGTVLETIVAVLEKRLSTAIACNEFRYVKSERSC